MISKNPVIKKAISLLLILCLAAGLCSCTPSKKKDERVKYSCNIWDSFDTVITILAYCGSEDEFREIQTVANDLFSKYNRLFDIYNGYEGISNIKTINAIAICIFSYQRYQSKPIFVIAVLFKGSTALT